MFETEKTVCKLTWTFAPLFPFSSLFIYQNGLSILAPQHTKHFTIAHANFLPASHLTLHHLLNHSPAPFLALRLNSSVRSSHQKVLTNYLFESMQPQWTQCIFYTIALLQVVSCCAFPVLGTHFTSPDRVHSFFFCTLSGSNFLLVPAYRFLTKCETKVFLSPKLYLNKGEGAH